MRITSVDIPIPMLTEVVDAPSNPINLPVLSSIVDMTAVPPSGLGPSPSVDAERITQQVLTDLHRQVDRMFEFRVRESVAPAVERMVDRLILELRDELTATLLDVVRKAVAQEMARQRLR
ncbi:MAG: hypothetical protein AB3X41_06260 [Leptothrix ochracea]|uniref:hypothetical protein n=1 Tax=Leptothrix ochracea TaxID=735331 RepID=UPI0034E23DD8